MPYWRVAVNAGLRVKSLQVIKRHLRIIAPTEASIRHRNTSRENSTSFICDYPCCGKRQEPRLILKPDEHRRFVDRSPFGHNRICGKTFIRPAQRNTFHNDLIVGNTGVFAHDR